MKRNRADIGRLVIGVLIVACLVFLPLRQYALSERSTYENVIQATLDECTDRVQATRKFSVRDYEELTNALYGTGAVYDIEIEVGRFTENLADYAIVPSKTIIEYLLGPAVAERDFKSDCDCIGTDGGIRTVATHTHTQDCYVGHNHQASGCTFDGRSWSCGIDTNDTTPVCSHVVVAADWIKTQEIESGRGATIAEGGQLDNTLILTMLDGSRISVKAKVMDYDDLTVGTKSVAMLYNAYFNTAFGNTKSTSTFDVAVTIIKAAHTCPICGLTYDGAEDGSDPGCPYCHNKILNVTANPANVYGNVDDTHALDELVITAEYADGHTEEVVYTSDFDSHVAGMQTITAVVTGVERVPYTDHGIDKEAVIDNNEGRVAVTVRLSSLRTCPICLTVYPCAIDGTDPGCPYCNGTAMDLEIVPVKTEYVEGEPIKLNVYSVHRLGKTLLEDFAWYSDYDPWLQGLQKVHVFHENLIKTVEVSVVDPYRKVCPICGTVFDERVDSSCPSCAEALVALDVTAVPEVYSYGEEINLTVWAEYRSGEKVLLTTGYDIEGYDEYKTDEPQVVTISYKGIYTSVVVTVMPRAELPTNIVVCPNGHFYELNQDGSDPGCPYCAGAEGIDEDNRGTYYTDMMYTAEVLAWLGTYGTIEFDNGDSFTIRVRPKTKTIAHRVSDFFVKTAVPRNTFVSGITIGK